jgi:integrase
MRITLYRGRYYAVWPGPNGTQRRALRTADRAEAERRLADLTRRPVGPAVADIFDKYLAEKDLTTARPDRLHDAWKALRTTFGHLRPDQIDRPLCRAYAAKRRREGRRDGTINKELAILRAALRWHDPHTPAVLELPPPGPARTRRLDRAEYDHLLAAAQGTPHLALFITLALATAGRSRAILDLTWDRVDFVRGHIVLGDGAEVRAKGRATVPMTATARRALEAAFRVRRTTYVIEYADRPVASVKKAFARACTRARLAGVTPHTLRHTAAVWMAEAGVPMSEIAQYLGHADDRITQRVYAKYSPNYLRRAAAALE